MLNDIANAFLAPTEDFSYQTDKDIANKILNKAEDPRTALEEKIKMIITKTLTEAGDGNALVVVGQGTYPPNKKKTKDTVIPFLRGGTAKA